MGLNIKKTAVEDKIRKLAARTGESLTDAIASAVDEKLARLEQEEEANRPARTLEEFRARLKPIQDEIAEARRRSGDTRTAREMVNDLYDDYGLPK